jgi:hypothetical protein
MPHQSATVAYFVFWQEICYPAFSDFLQQNLPLASGTLPPHYQLACQATTGKRTSITPQPFRSSKWRSTTSLLRTSPPAVAIAPTALSIPEADRGGLREYGRASPPQSRSTVGWRSTTRADTIFQAVISVLDHLLMRTMFRLPLRE